MSIRTLAMALILAALPFADAARACNLPVFRYALERWNKRQTDDLYSLYVFHDGAFPEALRQDLNDLDERLEDPRRLANLLAYRIDTSKEIADEFIAAVHETEKSKAPAKGPWMALRFPFVWGLERSLYVGPYDRAVIEDWLLSPLRQSIARHLLQGESAVFLLLESGDQAKDDEAFERVRKQLSAAEKEADLPDLTEAPKDQLFRDDIPLKISFVLLRLARDDPREQRLVEMLQAMDHDDLLAKEKEPVLIPIYGRGIAMVNECLIGKGITQENLGGQIRFLLGPCSCEVRRLNPGIEMLTAIDWDGPAPPAPDLAGASAPSTDAPADVAVETTGPDSTASSRRSGTWGPLMWVLGVVLGVVFLGSIMILGQRK